MAEIEVTEEVTVKASVDEVWTVVTAPELQPILNPRLALRSIVGEPGEVGSSYELGVGAVAKSDPFRTSVTVLEAVPAQRLVTVHRIGKNEARHTGELTRDGDQTRLRWTTTGSAGLLRKSREAKMRSELVRWLGAVAQLAEARQA